MCQFGPNIDFIAKFCQYWKNKKKRGWAKTRAIVSRPLIWNPKVWSPYRNESLNDIAGSVFCRYLGQFWLFFNRKHLNVANSQTCVSRRNIWPLINVPTRRNECNSYVLSTIMGRHSKQKKLWNAPRRDELCGGLVFYQTHRATGDTGTWALKKTYSLHFWLHGPYM